MNTPTTTQPDPRTRLTGDLRETDLGVLLRRLDVLTRLAQAKASYGHTQAASLLVGLACGDRDAHHRELRRVWRELDRRFGPLPVGD